jgi:hypothetical protein
MNSTLPAHLLFALLLLLAAPGVAQRAVQTQGATAPGIKSAEKPIPPFTVWQLRPGESTESQVTAYQLNPSGYWLMLYVDASSKASLDLLAQVQTLAQTQALDRSGALLQPTPKANGAPSYSQFKLDASRLVIVLANATGAQLSQFQLNYPGLTPAAWTHDSNGAAAKLLGISGTPHLFGMREGLQRWQLPDTLRPHDLEPVITTWLALNRLPANKLTRNTVKHPAAGSIPRTAAGIGPNSPAPAAPALPATAPQTGGTSH